MSRVTIAQISVTALLVCLNIGLAAERPAAPAAEDGIIHGCAKQSSGALRLVPPGTACGPSEVTVTWNAQGPGTPGGGLKVYDSTGRIVGHYIAFVPPPDPQFGPFGAGAALFGPGTSVLFAVSKSGFRDTSSFFNPVSFVHTSVDCSGERFLFSGRPDDFLPPAAVVSGEKLIVPHGPPVVQTWNSIEEFNLDNPPVDYTGPGVCRPRISNDPAYPTFTVNASEVGKPPFTVR
jgi:hypothetical protein